MTRGDATEPRARDGPSTHGGRRTDGPVLLPVERHPAQGEAARAHHPWYAITQPLRPPPRRVTAITVAGSTGTTRVRCGHRLFARACRDSRAQLHQLDIRAPWRLRGRSMHCARSLNLGSPSRVDACSAPTAGCAALHLRPARRLARAHTAISVRRFVVIVVVTTVALAAVANLTLGHRGAAARGYGGMSGSPSVHDTRTSRLTRALAASARPCSHRSR